MYEQQCEYEKDYEMLNWYFLWFCVMIKYEFVGVCVASLNSILPKYLHEFKPHKSQNKINFIFLHQWRREMKSSSHSSWPQIENHTTLHIVVVASSLPPCTVQHIRFALKASIRENQKLESWRIHHEVNNRQKSNFVYSFSLTLSLSCRSLLHFQKNSMPCHVTATTINKLH